MIMRTPFVTAASVVAAAILVGCRVAGPGPADADPASAAQSCPGLMVVIVNNDSGVPLDVFSTRDRQRVLLGTVPPGRAELAIEPADARFVAMQSGTRKLIASSTSQRTANAVRFAVDCKTTGR